MSAPLRLVLASNNAKKLKELGALFGPLPIELVTQRSEEHTSELQSH